MSGQELQYTIIVAGGGRAVLSLEDFEVNGMTFSGLIELSGLRSGQSKKLSFSNGAETRVFEVTAEVPAESGKVVVTPERVSNG